MKKEIDLTLWHEGCWMLELTRDHPDVELVVDDICSNSDDILARVTATAERGSELDGLVEEYAPHSAIRTVDVLDRDERTLTLHTRYDIGSSIYNTIIESSLTPIREIHVHDDREEWTLISEDAELGSAISRIEESCRIEIDRVTDFRPAEQTATNLLEEIEAELSMRQQEYLLSALSEGYYSWPRDVSAKDLAAQHDVSGPTALEHLRKGEAVVLQRLLGELAERADGPRIEQ